MIFRHNYNLRDIAKQISSIFIVISISVLLFLIVDFFLGSRLLALVDPHRDQFRVSHPIYHHDLSPGFKGIGYWGDWTYPVCTDENGFKISCNNIDVKEKIFDVAFIGDSFTEGIGLPYEKTFVGLVAKQKPELKIANLGVVSYSPAIYLSKLTYLFEQGYRFKHIIVFIDIGDVYDEANSYDLFNNRVVVDKGEKYPFSMVKQLRRWAIRKFPIAALASNKAKHIVVQQVNEHSFVKNLDALKVPRQSDRQESSFDPASLGLLKIPKSPNEGIKDIKVDEVLSVRNIYEGVYDKDYPKSEWTYNTHSSHYRQSGVLGTLDQMKLEMNELILLAKEYGSDVSIGVYPWPGQLMYDNVNSLQVQLWKEFCIGKCLHFYNVFPELFHLVDDLGTHKVITDYYFSGDVHFTEKGNKVIADKILQIGIDN